MEKIKKLLIISCILAIALIIISAIISRKNQDIDGIGATEDIIDYSVKKTNSASVYYTVESYVKRYVQYLSLDLTSVKSNDNDDVYSPEIYTDEEKYEYIYNILSKDYKKNNNISLSNINKYISVTNEPLNFTALEINGISYENTRVYAIYGRISKESNKELVSYSYFKLILDIKNNTYAIEPINDCNNINNIDMSEVESVPSTGKNAFSYLKISEVELVNKYFKYYKEAVINYPEEIYNKLSDEYRNIKFKNLDEFKDYINIKKDDIKKLKLQQYKKTGTGSDIQYVLLDSNGNYYIFNSTAIMQFELLLDTYTIDIPEFIEKYYGTEPTEKVALNIQKIFEAINNKDYNYVYGKLADGFKKNYFPTLDSFKEYAKENFYDRNEVEYLFYEKESEEYYSYTIKISDKDTEKSKNLKIIMQLQSGTNFVMSFNVN